MDKTRCVFRRFTGGTLAQCHLDAERAVIWSKDPRPEVMVLVEEKDRDPGVVPGMAAVCDGHAGAVINSHPWWMATSAFKYFVEDRESADLERADTMRQLEGT